MKINPVDIKSNTYTDPGQEINEKDPKFKIGDNVKISEYKNILAKSYTPNWSEKVFFIKKVKNTVLRTYAINDLNGKKIARTIYEKELQTANQKKKNRIGKVIKTKGNNLFVKWKGYDNPFNSWIVKKKALYK